MMRWVILAILIIGLAANQLQQDIVGLLFPILQHELSFSASQIGIITSAFVIGLIAGYILMTLITVFAGSRWGLAIGFGGAAVASFASIGADNFTFLLVYRFSLGFFTAALIPATVQAIREWFPAPLRPLAIGLVLAFSGSVFSSLYIYFIRDINWHISLALPGIPVFIVAILCAFLAKPPPVRDASPRLNAAAVVSSIMLVLGLFLTTAIFIDLGTFLVTYLYETGINLQSSSISSLIIAFGGSLGALFSGVIACVLIYIFRKSSKIRAAVLTVCGLLLPLTGLIRYVQGQVTITLLSFFAMAGCFGIMVLLYAGVADTLPVRGVAIATAIGGLAMAIGSMIFPYAFGSIVDQFGYGSAFLMIGGIGVIAWLVVSIPGWFIKQPDAAAPEVRAAVVPPPIGSAGA